MSRRLPPLSAVSHSISSLLAHPLYVGIDATAPSAHVGHLLPMAAAAAIARTDRPDCILLIGDATGAIGDPTGRTAPRDGQASSVIDRNADALEAQLLAVLERRRGAGTVRVVRNSEWLSGLSFLDFLHRYAAAVPTREFLGRRHGSVEEQEAAAASGDDGGWASLAGSTRVSELMYPFMQGIDFVELAQRHGVRTQVGGSDQWGNMCTGMRLAGHLGLPQLSVATTELLVDSSGRKLGKSTGGAVWLDPTLTPIFDFYQYFLGMDDALARTLLPALLPSSVSQVEIDTLLHEDPESRAVQRAVADCVTDWVHGDTAVVGAQAAGSVLYRDRGAAIAASLHATGSLAPEQAAALAVVRRATLVESPTTVADAFVLAGLSSSRSDLRRLVKGRGVRLNGSLVTRDQADAPLSHDDVLQVPGVGRCFLGSVGKSSLAVVVLP